MKAAFESKNRKFEIVENPIDKAWTDRPTRPENPLEIMPVERAGQSWQDKVENVRKDIKKAGCQGPDLFFQKKKKTKMKNDQFRLERWRVVSVKTI